MTPPDRERPKGPAAAVMETGELAPLPLPPAVRALVTAHRALVEVYSATSLRFTLDGKLVGDIAEATAAEAFELALCRFVT